MTDRIKDVGVTTEDDHVWFVDDCSDLCCQLAKKYGLGNSVQYYKRSPRVLESLSKLLAYCEEEGIDPGVFITAQFAILGPSMARNGRILYHNSIFGKAAITRYNSYLEQRHRFTRTMSAKDETRRYTSAEDNPLFEAELMYATCYVRLRLIADASEVDARKEAKSVARMFCADWHAAAVSLDLRLLAASHVLNDARYGLANYVRVTSDDWTWEDIARIIYAHAPPPVKESFNQVANPRIGSFLH